MTTDELEDVRLETVILELASLKDQLDHVKQCVAELALDVQDLIELGTP